MKTHYFQHSRASIKLLFCMLITTTMMISSLQAQSLYKSGNSKDNVIKILGKSNVHDWVMTAESPVSEADFGLTAGAVKSLNSLSFSVDAKNLKSEHESMDKRALKTIKADAHPKITFKLASAVVTPIQKDKFSIKATGTLTIAGVSRPITMQVNGVVKTDNTITCTGQQKIKLTDFGVDPPSFMLGAMKVGDDLTIQYTLNFNK